MNPPGAVCRALYRMHPRLRLAWHGREKNHADELNPGSFAVVQLYHISDAGRPDESATYYEHWNPPGHFFGPIFDRDGGGKQDWDPLFYKPIYAANLEDFGVPKEDVFSGKFLETIRLWLVPIQRRVREAARAKGRDLKRKADDVSAEAAAYLWRQAQKPDATRPVIAWKHLRKQVKAWERQAERAAGLEDYFMIPGM